MLASEALLQYIHEIKSSDKMLPPVGIEPWPLIASHEQKFKNLLSSKCQVSVERRVLDLESEVMRG